MHARVFMYCTVPRWFFVSVVFVGFVSGFLCVGWVCMLCMYVCMNVLIVWVSYVCRHRSYSMYSIYIVNSLSLISLSLCSLSREVCLFICLRCMFVSGCPAVCLSVFFSFDCLRYSYGDVFLNILKNIVSILASNFLRSFRQKRFRVSTVFSVVWITCLLRKRVLLSVVKYQRD